jgi:amino acid adenylation domain-containing protein
MNSSVITDIAQQPELKRTPPTLVELLRWRAKQQPEQVAYTFLLTDGTEECRLTYGELDRKARKIAAALQALNLRSERVLLLYPAGLEYIAAFFGCLYAGAVAVPAYPPRSNHKLARLQSIIVDAQAKMVLTTQPILSKMETLFEDCPESKSLRYLITENISDSLVEFWRPAPVGEDTLAFLQYTSGSTSTPKGVMVSHGNLLHNENLISRAFEQGAESVIVSWLPLYHDMGLIGGVLQPLYLGAHCVLMSPLSFLQHPALWLETIARYRATTSGAPNFAYDLCVRKISAEQRRALDLSSWNVAFNGAEPVRQQTIERFAETFAASGFRRESFSPCYGLAEATLLVSGGKKTGLPVVKALQAKALEKNRVAVAERDQEGVRYIVSCGNVPPEQKVLIVDSDSLLECQRGEVGEVWVAGASVAQGYWNNHEATEKTFHAHLRESGEGPFLRTGDLGFIDDGELFITGRLKDLIIFRGLNYYPHDIELTAEQSHPELRPGGGAAFAIHRDGAEQLVVVQEVAHRHRGEMNPVLDAIREAVAVEHEVKVSTVLLTKAGSIPKTSSGKIRRSDCRQMFLAGDFEVVAEWREGDDIAAPAATPAATMAARPESAESIEVWLVSHLARKLGVEPSRINPAQPIVRYGVDSFVAIELAHLMESNLGVNMSMASFLQSSTIRELAAVALAQMTVAPPARGLSVAAESQLSEQPLSLGQQSLWFMQNLAPESAAYNIARALRVKTKLDVPALRRALQTLVERHAALRTTFHESHGKPVQRVHAHVEVSVHQEDATSWSEAHLNERLTEEAHQPFNLEAWPLLRVSLFRRAEDEHVLLLVIHHIISDFWSLALIVQELGALYAAERDAAPAALAPLKAQYTDYVRWQTEMSASPEITRNGDYWQAHLSGELPLLNLLPDNPRPAFKTFSGGTRSFKFDAELSVQLKKFSREHSATPYMTLLAAFYVLLYRHTGQEDLIVGTLTSGRRRSEFAGTIGYFVNALALRADLSGDPTFSEVVERVRALVLSGFEHQDYPFSQLVERLQPQRDPARSPLFDVVFVLQKAQLLEDKGLSAFALEEPGAEMELNGLHLESMPLERRAAQFDLMLMIAESGAALSGTMEYNTDVFAAATISRLAQHYGVLLSAALATPARPLSHLPLLTEAERHQLLWDWNAPARHLYPDASLHQLFEAQARRTPTAVAIRSEWGTLTYAELDAQAETLARYLRQRGVRAETLVGVCLERTPHLVVGLLGVLKAGGAYLPLDPAYPRERLRVMVSDAQARYLLTQESVHELAHWAGEAAGGVEVISLDEQWAQIVAAVDGESGATSGDDRQTLAGQLAYVIYTSGSTGHPKGVMLTHASAATLVRWAHETFSRADLSGVLASTSICFDLAVFELFVPLSGGGCVILVTDALALERVEARHEVTLVNTVPSAMAELLRLGAVPSSVRVVNLAGEALEGALVAAIYAQLPQVREVWNLYGPTEDTTYSTARRVERGVEKPSIGWGVAGTRLYIVDERQQLVGAGVVGELVLGGAGEARGYLGRPELTAERFVPDGVSGVSGGRLYRTGDMGRHIGEAGEVEYLGRVDQQVKVRGYRIELGEVEAALVAQARVREAVVVAREDGARGKRLVGYVVLEAEDGTAATAAAATTAATAAATAATADTRVRELRERVRERLPEYMVPAAVVVLAEMPRTANGKVDRKRLPEVERWGDADGVSAGGAGRGLTAVEEVVAGIWSEVLGVESVEVEGNFFALGGHSLMATQVVSRVREVFGVEVALRQMFESPTVAALAQNISRALSLSEKSQLPPIQRTERRDDVPLSFAQQRLWFMDQLEPGQSVYNIPAAVRLSGALDVAALEESLNELVRRHEILRTTFLNVNGKSVQLIAPSLLLPLKVKDLRKFLGAEQEAELQWQAREEGQRAFHLERGPLLRAVLYQLAEDEHVLQVTIHHIIGDGWSIGVLIRELSLVYEAASRGERALLAELPIQYADFAFWQREFLQGETLAHHLEYWKRQLDGAPPLLLPTDYPRPPVQTFRGSYETFVVPADLTASLYALSRREGVTLFMTLLAAFQTLLYRFAQQSDITIGADIANRNRVETEGLIGFFVNMMVLRVDLSDAPNFSELLQRVRRICLEAYTHQDVPFEKLVEELQPERNLSSNPLFQVVFVLQNAPMPPLELPGLTISPLAVDSEMVQFDLILSITEVDDELRGRLSYDVDLFVPATIKRLAQHFQVLLESIVAHPQERLSQLSLLSADETNGYAPTDFPDMALSQKDFENLVLEISNASGE